MSIYTKTGDDGTTALYGGIRVLKSDPQVEAYGTIDEVSSSIGIIISQSISRVDSEELTSIQKDLYGVMAFLCGAPISVIHGLLTSTQTLEENIDKMEKKLTPLHRFILPQGTSMACFCHMSRCIVRRAERQLVKLAKVSSLDQDGLQTVLQFINRLSDYLFVLSRWYNRSKGDILT